jgi:hypothetical protein
MLRSQMVHDRRIRLCAKLSRSRRRAHRQRSAAPQHAVSPEALP